MPQKYRRFADFYPYYLSEHANRTCRPLHFVGTSGAPVLLIAAAAAQNACARPRRDRLRLRLRLGRPFRLQKNRPATFTHPIYSLIGDWVMWAEIATGRIRF